MIVIRYSLNTKLTGTEYDHIKNAMEIYKYLSLKFGNIETVLMVKSVCNKVLSNIKTEKIKMKE